MSASASGPAVQSGTAMTVSEIAADSVSCWPFLLQGGGAIVARQYQTLAQISPPLSTLDYWTWSGWKAPEVYVAS